jgi:hypothetical protein
MDNKQKTKHEKMFQEGNIPFPFEKCEKMAEMIKTYCAGEGRMADCCSMMKKMMGCGEGEQTTRKKEETEEKDL